MTTRQAVASILRWALDRVDPPEPTTDIVTPPLTWPAPVYLVDWTRCPRCGTYTAPNAMHACWTIDTGTSAPLPWPGSSITYTNGAIA